MGGLPFVRCPPRQRKAPMGGDGDLKIRLTNNSGLIKEADWGFSWKTLLFGLFVPLVRGDLAWFFIGFFLSIFTAGIALLVFPFTYNKIYVKKLLAQGFYPADELSRMTLVNAGIIRDQVESTRTELKVPQPASIPLAPMRASTPVQPEGWVCSLCQTENGASHHFCYSCGHERENPKPVCPSCGASMEGKMRFCPACGAQARNPGTPTGIAQGPQSTPSQQAPVSVIPQNPPPQKSSLPVAALAVVVLGLGALIFLAKGDVLFSFFKSPSKVTASQENPPAQAVNQPAPVVQAAVQPDTVLRFPASGWISASNVNMRAGHSILAQRISTLPRGQNVTVLDSWISGSDQEGILKQDLYVEIGGRTKTLGKGRAVSLLQHDPSQGTYLVSLKDKSGTISGWTSETNVKSLKGALWYKVSTSSGKTGWILGEFISINR